MTDSHNTDEYIAQIQTENELLRDALKDMLAGWVYIRLEHGDLYGVGWDRAQDKAVRALSNEILNVPEQAGDSNA